MKDGEKIREIEIINSEGKGFEEKIARNFTADDWTRQAELGEANADFLNSLVF